MSFMTSGLETQQALLLQPSSHQGAPVFQSKRQKQRRDPISNSIRKHSSQYIQKRVSTTSSTEVWASESRHKGNEFGCWINKGKGQATDSELVFTSVL